VHYEVIIPRHVSRVLGSFGLDRHVLRLLLRLRQELETGLADAYRRTSHHRDEADPDRYFWCELSMGHQGRLRTFRFTIDDATSPSHRFVVAAEEVPD